MVRCHTRLFSFPYSSVPSNICYKTHLRLIIRLTSAIRRSKRNKSAFQRFVSWGSLGIEDSLFDRKANARNGGTSREKHCISVDTWSSLRTWVSVLNLTLDLRYWKRMRHWSRKYLLKLLSESWSWRRFWLVKYLAKYTPSSSSRDVSMSCSVGFPGMLA